MGANNIQFKLGGEKTFSDVKQAFTDRVKEDRQNNGHQQGYSGDFQTVSEVKNHGHLEPFRDYDEAHEYCLDNAEKWDFVVAVKYLDKDKKPMWLIAGWGAS